MRRASWIVVAAILSGGPARGQEKAAAPISSADRAALVKALGKPSRPMMLPVRDDGGPSPIPAGAFTIANDVNAGMTFLVVPDRDSRATVADRHSLASATRGAYRCGQPTCYVRYMAGGAIAATRVAQSRAYHFYFVNGRFALYPAG